MDKSGMAGEDTLDFSIRWIAERHKAICSAGSHPLSIGRKRDGDRFWLVRWQADQSFDWLRLYWNLNQRSQANGDENQHGGTNHGTGPAANLVADCPTS
jgi:hypothetical protein